MDNKCYYCISESNAKTKNIGQQKFNDGTISNIKLNPINTSLWVVDTWNIPIKGREANMYTVATRINFCPICGRKLK